MRPHLSRFLCLSLMSPGCAALMPPVTAPAPADVPPAAEEAGDPTLATASNDLASSEMPWWRDESRLGMAVNYGFGSTEMGQLQRSTHAMLAGGACAAEDVSFGTGHNFELSVLYASPIRVTLQFGVGAFYNSTTAGLGPCPRLNNRSGEFTGRAWALSIPVLLGYRLPFWSDHFAVMASSGIEVVPWAGVAYTGDIRSILLAMTASPSVGWVGRAGLAWHPVRPLAITLELEGRVLETGHLLVDHGAPVVDPEGNKVRLDFSGVGARIGVAGFLF